MGNFNPIQWLQLVSGSTWLCLLAILTPCFLRIILGKADELDAFRLPVVFVAIVQIWFIVRWMIWPQAVHVMSYNELQGWAAAYVGNTITALTFIVANHFAQKFR